MKTLGLKQMVVRVLIAIGTIAASPLLLAATHSVEIRDYAFQPGTLTIKMGDTVTWVNRDSDPHTSTSSSSPPVWDSPFLSRNQTFSFTFTAAGTFNYHCAPHPFMRGTIVVEEGPSISPPVVQITAPANNANFAAAGFITVQATASATGGSISKVEFFSGGNLLGSDSTEPYGITVHFSTGMHHLTATATDSNGQTGTSSTVAITVGPSGDRITDPLPQNIEKGGFAIELEVVAENFVSPLGLAAPDDGSNRLFVFEQNGLIHVIAHGEKLETPLLDISDRLVVLNARYDERGLLGVATHPNFSANPFIYTYTSEPTGPMADFMIHPADGSTNNHQSVIAEWRIDPTNTNRVDRASRRELLRIDQPQSNHNGGTLRFGPDGMLYISTGDGGGRDDEGSGHSPGGNGQNLNNVLGKILRIDVRARTSGNGQYGVPTDNPFVGRDGVDEIWAYGFRNPYSFSFDRMNGELLVADVGQGALEELNLVFKGGNYGWPIKEGTFFFDPAGTNAGYPTTKPVFEVPADLIDPIAEYDHDDGLAIVGGFRYHGSRIPGLIGKYVTGDWGSFGAPSGRLYYLDRDKFKEFRIGLDNRPLGMWLKGFGEDQAGELYVLGSSELGPTTGSTGKLLRIVPVTPSISIEGITRTGNGLHLKWSSEGGTYVVQGKASLQEAVWHTIAVSQTNEITIPGTDINGFLRIAELSGHGGIPFTVALSGAAERPTPVDSPGRGSGTLSLEGDTLHFDISYSGLSSTATMAHIHGPAGAEQAAGVLINLGPYNGGDFGTSGRFSGSVVLTPVQKAHLLSGKTYVNVHTGTHPGGEIRGQIAPVLFTISLTGEAERPNLVTTGARGTGTLFLVGNKLTLNVGYQGIASGAQAAHIHGPADASEAAGVLINLATMNNGGFKISGALQGTVELTPVQMAYLLDGKLYINIHSPTYPGGEIRGQIRPQVTAYGLTASLSGAAERPNPVTTTAQGFGSFSLEGDILTFQVTYRGLSGAAIGAHIHGPAKASESAGVMINLGLYAAGGFDRTGVLLGQVRVSASEKAAILEGRTYVNIHTAENPGGEIRGQILPVLLRSTLLGATERNTSVQTKGKGSGSLVLVGNDLLLNLTYEGLSSPVGAAHIHGSASTSAAAGVLIGLAPLHVGAFGVAGSFAGSLTLTPDQLSALADELTYFNIHTSQYGAGEIRGQITY